MKAIITENQYKRLFEDFSENEEKKHIGDKVMVYYNLHKHTFSVRSNNRVVVHADYVKLVDVEFRVRQGGREKTEGRMPPGNLERCAHTIRARDTGSPAAQRTGRSETKLTKHEQQCQSRAPRCHSPV